MTCKQNRRKTAKTGTSLLSRFCFSEIDSLVAAQRELQNRLNTDRIIRKKTLLRRNESDDSLECLHCDGMMKVYRRPSGDQWACCPRCGYANDVPGLLADALHCSYREALDFLVFQHNLHHVDAAEIDELVHRRERYDRFASLLRERLYHDYAPTNIDAGHHLNVVALEKLLDRLDLLQYVDEGVNLVPNLLGKDEVLNDSKEESSRDIPPNWQSPLWHATDFFAVEHYRKIESWFYPNLVDAATKRIKPNTSPNRLFHGLGWDLVLVIPLQDVPGRFCGVLCIGREGRFPQDYVLRLFGEELATKTNPGFILPFRSFQAMVRGEDLGLSRLLAYNNPLHLVRCLLRNDRDFLPSIPLLGWIDHLESASHIASTDWTPFRSVRDKTFWIQRDDPITLRSIVEQNGKVVQYDIKSPCRTLVRNTHPSDDYRVP